MNKFRSSSCEKCGGNTKIHWQEGEKSSGMDIKPLQPSGMIKTCLTCGYAELLQDDGRQNAQSSK